MIKKDQKIFRGIDNHVVVGLWFQGLSVLLSMIIVIENIYLIFLLS